MIHFIATMGTTILITLVIMTILATTVNQLWRDKTITIAISNTNPPTKKQQIKYLTPL